VCGVAAAEPQRRLARRALTLLIVVIGWVLFGVMTAGLRYSTLLIATGTFSPFLYYRF
jgi:hypothetical protein